MISEQSRPVAVIVTRVLFIINGVIWILLAAVGFWRMSSGAGTMAVVYLLALADAAVLLWLGWRLGSRSRWIYFLALVAIAVNAVLSITDDLGLADIAVLCLNLVTLGLLWISRATYLSE
jgi:hypothetical protein